MTVNEFMLQVLVSLLSSWCHSDDNIAQAILKRGKKNMVQGKKTVDVLELFTG